MEYGKLTDLWHQLAMEPRRFNWKWINLILLMIQKDISKPFTPSKNQQQQISLPPAYQELYPTVDTLVPTVGQSTVTFQDWRQQISVPLSLSHFHTFTFTSRIDDSRYPCHRYVNRKGEFDIGEINLVRSKQNMPWSSCSPLSASSPFSPVWQNQVWYGWL